MGKVVMVSPLLIVCAECNSHVPYKLVTADLPAIGLFLQEDVTVDAIAR